MKVYARTIDPCQVDWEVWMEPYLEDGRYFLDGDDEYVSFGDETIITNYRNLIEELEDGCNRALDTLIEHFIRYYDKTLNSTEIECFNRLFEAGDEKELKAYYLTLAKGEAYDWFKITGCSQGEVAYVYAPEDTEQKIIDDMEAIYWGLGNEIMVHEGNDKPESPKDICGGCFYTSSYDEDTIKGEIAQECGCSIDDVVLYVFDGYIQSPKYKEC